MPMWKIFYWLMGWLCYGMIAYAQPLTPEPAHNETHGPEINPAASFIIGDIIISGNKRTKDYIIERELPFQAGDSIQLPELVERFETARQQLMNTRLFIEAIVSLKSFRGYYVDVAIELKERWYIFPIPYLKPIDRNLAEWSKQGYGTDRLNYGFKFAHYNFSGRNDKLRLWLITGYSKQIQFQYEQPYADESLKHGYKIGVGYSTNKEINYGTHHNQQLFTDSLDGSSTIFGNIEYNYRPGLRTFHSLRFGYTHFKMDERVLGLNADYYRDSVSSMHIPELSYTLKHYEVDYIPYPLTGWMGEASILKKGMHEYTDMWELGAKYNRAVDLGKKWYFNWQAQGTLRYPFDQPFYNSRLFGYNDMFLRGLEKYVVDGTAGLMSRQTFRKELFRFSIPTFINSATHDRVPFRVYAKAYSDMGYAWNRRPGDNSLANRMMFTAGAGIDVVTFYDFVFRLDYSFNQLGQNGLFLHFKNEF